MLHLGADGGGVLTAHPLLCQLGVLLQHIHRVRQVVVCEPAHLLCLFGVCFHRFHDGAARLFHAGHGSGQLRLRQSFVQRVQGVQLLLHVGQHLVHILHTGVERHLVLHHPGRADLLRRAKGHQGPAQRHQQRPQLIHRQHRAQYQKDQRHRVERQDAWLPGADRLAHVFLLIRGRYPLCYP